MTDLVWCPPPPRGGRDDTATVELLADLEKLKDKPGEWCRVRFYDSVNGASNVRNRLMQRRASLLDGFELVSRKVEGGSGLWGRWLNGNEP